MPEAALGPHNGDGPHNGKVVWSQLIGSAGGTGPFGIKSGLPLTIGTQTFGGAITTASGLTFVAATLDGTLRAFESKTGKLLWAGSLPSDGLATPLTYMARDGRQFVIIAAGDTAGGVSAASAEASSHPKTGAPIPSTAGGTLVAFALPKR